MFDFPNSPTTGQQVTAANGVVYRWDGAKWMPTTSGVVGSTNDVGRNLVHNPLFNVAQRGFGPWTTSGYTLDRWKLTLNVDAMNLQVISAGDGSRAGVGDESLIRYLQANFAGSGTAGAYSQLVQPIESVRRLSGKTITVSFWAGASSAGLKLGASLYQNFGTGGSPSGAAYVPGQSVTLTTGFVRYSLIFAIPSTSGKTLGTNGDDFTQLTFTYSDPAGIGVQSGSVSLWGVQLEVGSVATPLEKPDYQKQLADCQRFYAVGQVVQAGYGTAGMLFIAPYSLPVSMRAPPTLTITNFASIVNVTGVAMSPATGLASLRDCYGSGTVTATGAATLNLSFIASADL